MIDQEYPDAYHVGIIEIFIASLAHAMNEFEKEFEVSFGKENVFREILENAQGYSVDLLKGKLETNSELESRMHQLSNCHELLREKLNYEKWGGKFPTY